MNETSQKMWLVLFVAAVAVVGLLLQSMPFSGTPIDISGQAIASAKMKATAKSLTKTGTSTTTKCTDSDNGEDAYTKGTTKGEKLNDPSSGVQTFTDSCETNTANLKNFCTTDQCVADYYCEFDTSVLQESQASTGAVRPSWQDCDAESLYVCNNGACVYDKTAFPDLAVSFAQVAITPSTKTAVVTFKVKNSGGAAASIHSYAIDLGEMFADGSISSTSKTGTDTTSIAPGSTRTLTVSFSVGDIWLSDFETWEDDESMTVDINIDTKEEVIEQNEDNIYSKELSENAGDIIETT